MSSTGGGTTPGFLVPSRSAADAVADARLGALEGVDSVGGEGERAVAGADAPADDGHRLADGGAAPVAAPRADVTARLVVPLRSVERPLRIEAV